MELYFTPMACSIATRIALYEAGKGDEAAFHRVTLSSKTLDDGTDYYSVNPKGQVPALRLDDGRILTEGAAVLLYVGDLAPEAGLSPANCSFERYRLQELLNFVGSELHQKVLAVIFNPFAPEEAKAFARDEVAPVKLGLLAKAVEGKRFLLGDRFTVADAYAFFVLTLCPHFGIDLARWPSLAAYKAGLAARPSVARAVSEEMALMTQN